MTCTYWYYVTGLQLPWIPAAGTHSSDKDSNFCLYVTSAAELKNFMRPACQRLAIVPLLLAGFHVLWHTPAILDNEVWFPVSCTPGTCFVKNAEEPRQSTTCEVFAVKLNVSVRRQC